MGAIEYRTVPNQRIVSIHKSLTNKQNLYSMNNLSAIDEAARLLQSKGGFKLYMYFAKNQNKYAFALSSSDFMEWSGLAYSAYTSAFKELVQHGFLVQNPKKENEYFFYDKPCLAEEIEKLEQQKAGFTFNKNQSRTGFIF